MQNDEKITSEALTLRPQEQFDSHDIFFPGSRIGVLLIHGLTGTPAEMKFIAKRLNSYGFSVLCPRLAGHCGKETELLKTTWQDWYVSVCEAFHKFSYYADVIFAGGLSCGAVLSLFLAQHFPNTIRGLSLYSTTLRWDGWTITKLGPLLPVLLMIPIIGKRYRFKEEYPYGLKDERLRSLILKQMESGDAEAAGYSGTPGRSLMELARLVKLVMPKLPETDTPTILFHAKHDDIAAVGNALDVQKGLHGPTKLVLLENSYHMITIDQERKLVADSTAQYFYSCLNESEKTELKNAAKFQIPNHTLQQDENN